MTTYESIAHELLNAARTSGGVTLHPVLGIKPVSGYAVGNPYTGISFRDNEEANTKWIAQVVKECADKGCHVGSWRAPHGVIYIDAVDIVVSRDEAIEMGLSRTEIAIYDLAKGEEITLNY